MDNIIPKEALEKKCEICSASFPRNKKYSEAQWNIQRFCSRKCMGTHFFGRYVSPETRRKSSIAHLGHVHSEEQKQRIRIALTGKVKSLATREKLSIANSGSKSSLWKGGISSITRRIRSSYKYQMWRSKVLERDGFKCIWCGEDDRKKLEADHIRLFSKFPELRFDVDNGRTLCNSCHRQTPTYGTKARYYVY